MAGFNVISVILLLIPRLGAEGVPSRGPRSFGHSDRTSARIAENRRHEVGGPKAAGFERILGIVRGDVEYLVEALRAGVLSAPISDVRDNAPFSVLCEVRVPVAPSPGFASIATESFQ